MGLAIERFCRRDPARVSIPRERMDLAKEVRVSAEKEPLFGDLRRRGVHWEAATGLALLMAGADVVIFRHPEALARIRRELDSWAVA